MIGVGEPSAQPETPESVLDQPHDSSHNAMLFDGDEGRAIQARLKAARALEQAQQGYTPQAESENARVAPGRPGYEAIHEQAQPLRERMREEARAKQDVPAPKRGVIAALKSLFSFSDKRS